MNIATKKNLGQYEINEETKQITFTDLRWYKNDNGDYFPSVTTVLDAYPKPASFFEWLKKNGDQADEIRDAAGEKGSKIHSLIERFNSGDIVSLIDPDGRIRYSSQEWAALEKWVEFTNRFKPQILSSEFNIICKELGIAGTLDTKLILDGKKLIVDFKSSNAVYDHYFLQLAAYKKMHEIAFPEEKIDGAAILWLSAKTRSEGKKGDYQGKGYQLIFPPKDLDYYWNLFQHTYALWMEVNGDAKPKELIYQIEHKL